MMSPVLRREGRCLARTQRWPTDSPSQVELGDGIDGQVQADQVAVGVVLVGAAGRFTGFKENIEALEMRSLCLSRLEFNSGDVMRPAQHQEAQQSTRSAEHVSIVEFLQATCLPENHRLETRSRQTLSAATRPAGETQKQLFVCVILDVIVCMCEKERDWWACHLWICSSRLMVGPASSSLWMENLKPRDSWRDERRRGSVRRNKKRQSESRVTRGRWLGREMRG